MTITRETLELVALAIGETIECTEAEFNGCEPHSTLYTGVMLRGVQIAWRPHTDIGDAARTAVKLRGVMAVSSDAQGCHADNSEVRYPRPPDINVYVDHDGTDTDAERAYCEAVTLCAAEIGRKMKENQA